MKGEREKKDKKKKMGKDPNKGGRDLTLHGLGIKPLEDCSSALLVGSVYRREEETPVVLRPLLVSFVGRG